MKIFTAETEKKRKKNSTFITCNIETTDTHKNALLCL